MKESLEGWVHLVSHRLPGIKLLEWEHIGRDEDTDSGGNDLAVQIRDLPDPLNLLELLDAVEEHLRRVSGGHGTSEQGVLVGQHHHDWLVI